MGEQSSFGVDQEPVDQSADGIVDRGGVAGGVRPLRVLVADDNAVIRMGLRQLLAAEPAVELVGEACDGEQALQLAAVHDPDVVLLDVRMAGKDGPAVLPELSRRCCVLMLTGSDDDETIRTALAAGARGYLVYGTLDETGIVQILGAAAGGGSVLSEPASRVLREDAARQRPGAPQRGRLAPRPEVAALLSEREVTVMELLAAGRSNSEIAATLFLASKTVKNHINRIFAKLHVTTRSQAIAVWLGTNGEYGPSAGRG